MKRIILISLRRLCVYPVKTLIYLFYVISNIASIISHAITYLIYNPKAEKNKFSKYPGIILLAAAVIYFGFISIKAFLISHNIAILTEGIKNGFYVLLFLILIVTAAFILKVTATAFIETMNKSHYYQNDILFSLRYYFTNYCKSFIGVIASNVSGSDKGAKQSRELMYYGTKCLEIIINAFGFKKHNLTNDKLIDSFLFMPDKECTLAHPKIDDQIIKQRQDVYKRKQLKKQYEKEKRKSLNNKSAELPNKDSNNVINNEINNSDNMLSDKYKPVPDRSLEEILQELDSLTGLDKVKKSVYSIKAYMEAKEIKMQAGVVDNTMSEHLIFLGNPGTGKTTVARLIGELYKHFGLLEKGHVVEVTRADLVGEYNGETAVKTKKKVKEAFGGVLFIDEAYALINDESDTYGKEAVNTLVAALENYRDKFVCIVAGYRTPMSKFIQSNMGLESRFKTTIEFDDYTPAQLSEIFTKMANKSGYTITADANKALNTCINRICLRKTDTFANARTIRNYYEKTIQAQSERISLFESVTKDEITVLSESDILNAFGLPADTDEQTYEDAINKLKELTGLASVKKCIDEMVAYTITNKKKMELGLTPIPMSLHMVFTGNPGTGKTTVARLLGDIFKGLDILDSNKVVEVTRADLVGKYVGETAIKTKEVINSALGGILFIDEAYTLNTSKSDDFGKEAIDTLLKMMEDHRNNLIVIVAGYDCLMKEFIESNPGLKSRFTRVLHFDDYNEGQLYEIFTGLCDKYNLFLDDEAAKCVTEYFKQLAKGKTENFGNAREVRKFFEKITVAQSMRIADLTKKFGDVPYTDLVTITKQDIIFQ